MWKPYIERDGIKFVFSVNVERNLFWKFERTNNPAKLQKSDIMNNLDTKLYYLQQSQRVRLYN